MITTYETLKVSRDGAVQTIELHRPDSLNALTPQTAGQLVGDGHEVLVQAGAGEASSSLDEAYDEAGATIVPDAPTLYSQAEMVLRVGRPSDEEIEMLRSGSVGGSIFFQVSFATSSVHVSCLPVASSQFRPRQISLRA